MDEAVEPPPGLLGRRLGGSGGAGRATPLAAVADEPSRGRPRHTVRGAAAGPRPSFPLPS